MQRPRGISQTRTLGVSKLVAHRCRVRKCRSDHTEGMSLGGELGKMQKTGMVLREGEEGRMGFVTRKTPEDRDVGHLMGQCGLGEHSVKVGTAGPGGTAGPKVLHLQDGV